MNAKERREMKEKIDRVWRYEKVSGVKRHVFGTQGRQFGDLPGTSLVLLLVRGSMYHQGRIIRQGKCL